MKRIARDKPEEHKKLDTMKPLQFANLGSSDDPCFGNYSAKAPECKRCGDSEICAAVSTKKLLDEIDEVEKTKDFKDNDEGNLVDAQNLEIGKIMVDKAWNKSKDPDQWFTIEKLIPKLTEKFNLTPKDKDVLIQRCIKAGKETKKLTFNKKLTKYKAKA